MKVRVLSDLHNECLSTVDAINLIPVMDDEHEQVLVLAGDIFVIAKEYTYIEFLNNMCSRFKHVVFVPGNHEYYHGCMPLTKAKFYQKYTPLQNFTWLDGGDTVTIDGTLFVGETLWTDYHDLEYNERIAETYMNDYRLITVGDYQQPKKLTAKHIKSEHVAALRRLATNIQQDCVVVTHHGVSANSVAPEYLGNPLNPAFYSELTQWLEVLGKSPALWVHGHTHSSHDYMLGTTRVVVNPRGYPNYSGTFENKEFDPKLIVNIDNLNNKGNFCENQTS